MCVACSCLFVFCSFFFFKQKTAYEMRISDWSSDVCSSDLNRGSDEDHECPALWSPPDVERNNKGCHRPRGRAIPLKHGQAQFAHTVPISSRPINFIRHAFVPAPISLHFASRLSRPPSHTLLFSPHPHSRLPPLPPLTT